MWLAVFLIGVLILIVLAGGFLVALMLGLIVFKAVERPERGESTDYRLEQGQEVEERSLDRES